MIIGDYCWLFMIIYDYCWLLLIIPHPCFIIPYPCFIIHYQWFKKRLKKTLPERNHFSTKKCKNTGTSKNCQKTGNPFWGGSNIYIYIYIYIYICFLFTTKLLYVFRLRFFLFVCACRAFHKLFALWLLHPSEFVLKTLVCHAMGAPSEKSTFWKHAYGRLYFVSSTEIFSK